MAAASSSDYLTPAFPLSRAQAKTIQTMPARAAADGEKWAHVVDVTRAVPDFRDKVPVMAKEVRALSNQRGGGGGAMRVICVCGDDFVSRLPGTEFLSNESEGLGDGQCEYFVGFGGDDCLFQHTIVKGRNGG